MKIREQFIPVMRPVGGAEEVEALAQVIDSGWWGKGPLVQQFEQEFAALVGAKYAVAVTSASTGQDLVFKAMGFTGVDVLSPTMSFVTTAVVPLWNQCESILVDVDEDNLNIDPLDFSRALTPRTKVAIVVNNAGVLAPVERIRESFDGFIIEDCAHSCYTPGAGSRGDAAVWSFHAVKTLAAGDGGMITTDDASLYEKLVMLTWLGIPSTFSRTRTSQQPTGDVRPGYAWDYEVSTLGYKAYMNDLTAAVALQQLHKLDSSLERRRRVESRYNEGLSDLIQTPTWTETAQHYYARVDPNLRDDLINYLSTKKIHTSVHYKPLHLHPLLRQDRSFPVADREWKRLISLPVHSGMTDDDIDYVVYWIRRFLEDPLTAK
jgi:perosamine synthetase